MTIKRYEYRCPSCGITFESKQMAEALCPQCDRGGIRHYGSVPHYKPSAQMQVRKR